MGNIIYVYRKLYILPLRRQALLSSLKSRSAFGLGVFPLVLTADGSPDRGEQQDRAPLRTGVSYGAGSDGL